ncbi:MAG: hypothetical protein M1127_02220 [Patescibacteria group bacterium]|nr:hypothetical protein [Patescibacteria group bacterium]
MNKKIIFSFIAGFFMITGTAVFLANEISAQEAAAGIQYPVGELGNCQNETACKTYCDKPENMEACLDFAARYNLMSEQEISTAKKFAASNSEKPGKCTTKDSCEEYCNDINHIDECVAFAEKNNLLPPSELEEAKKVQSAIKKGVKPPACGNKKACDVYCDSAEHMEECVNFAMEAGFMSEQEKADSQKMLAAIKKGVKPPPCKGKEACDEYCSSPDNMETCMTFAMEAGFMSEQEKADSQKMLAAIKKGVKPPNCKGKECDSYCQQEKHFDECLNFSEAAGFMSAEDAAMARKTGGKGPGGCKNKEECEAFCNNPDNQETCFNFGKENGMIPEEDLKRMEEGKQQFKQSMQQAPQQVLDCLNSQLGSDMLEKLKSGTIMPTQQVGESMKSCFEKMGPPPEQQQQNGGPGAGGMIPPAGQAGPGGCKTQDECMAYCKEHIEECSNFQPTMPQGGPGPGGPNNNGINGGGMGGPDNGQQQGRQYAPAPGQIPAGPGGCKTPEECQSFCASNTQECQNFNAPIPQTVPSGQSGPTGGQGDGQGSPAGGADSGMGMGGGGIINAQPICDNPEQCQQIQQMQQQAQQQMEQMQQQAQQQMQQRMQNRINQMAPPTQPCEGEGCNYGPPSAQQQIPQPPMPTGQNATPPTQQTQPMPQAPQQPPMPQTESQPPMPQVPPAIEQQPPNENPPAPAPAPAPAPTPSPAPEPGPGGFLAPEMFLGSIVSAFNQVLGSGK